jgi:hypothetical protein
MDILNEKSVSASVASTVFNDVSSIDATQDRTTDKQLI